MSKESDKKDAADKADAAAADKFAADETAAAKDEKVAEANDILNKDATAAQTTPPAGVEDIRRHAPPPNQRLQGKYDFAAVTNALNNVLNLRNVPGLDKAGLVAEFEAQLCEILDASAVTPDKWNKTLNRDAQEPGQTYQGHPA